VKERKKERKKERRKVREREGGKKRERAFSPFKIVEVAMDSLRKEERDSFFQHVAQPTKTTQGQMKLFC
jgi:hypothetical protein